MEFLARLGHCSRLLLDNICTSLNASILAICIFIYLTKWHVEAKFAYLFTSGSRLRITLLDKLCTLRDDGATAGSSLESRFPEYLTVSPRCVGCQECQHVSFPSGYSLILERAKNHRRLSQTSKVAGPVL
jgi:hypothetical protein